MPDRRRFLTLLTLIVLLVASSGCVSRRLTIRTDPPGALVEVDGERLGLTPVSMDFTYYGEREITLSAPGYETEVIRQPIPTPWYQVPPFDFVSDNFLPVRLTNRHDFTYRLRPRDPSHDDHDNLRNAANNFRSQAQVGP
ncbi:MAG: PEGA domain-containing protein [Maioricimonas sp. JB049]